MRGVAGDALTVTLFPFIFTERERDMLSVENIRGVYRGTAGVRSEIQRCET